MLDRKTERQERPFEGLKIYYSGSIRGAKEADPNFPWELVQFMKENGANVLSEHVAGRNKDEMDSIRATKLGMSVEELRGIPRELFVKDVIRKQDLEWVDEATHVVALVNAPSHGVGMELQEAILKPRLGLNETPVLCLIHKDLLDKLSGMITGVRNEESSKFYVRSYAGLADAQETIFEFLTGRLK
jgi:hypothetical protein